MIARRVHSKHAIIGGGRPFALWWSLSMCVAFGLGSIYSRLLSEDQLTSPPNWDHSRYQNCHGGTITKELPRKLLNLPDTVKYIYINIGTSWDPWPGCGTKGLANEIKSGHNNADGGLPYDPEEFCIYVEPLMRVNTALYERGVITNSSISIHTAIGPTNGLMPFYEYAGVSGVASSLSVVADEIVEREVKNGSRGPFSSGARGQAFTTVVTLKELLDIIPDHIRILQMKTDMQGFDVTAIQSAGEDIKRIDEIFHECYGDGELVEYEGAPIPNTYQAAKALLEPFGFESGKSKKHDCNWRRRGVSRLSGKRYIGNF
ncbi:hypothetical protein ACHAWX_001019 [Stephanocyclus meneghinianus]